MKSLLRAALLTATVLTPAAAWASEPVATPQDEAPAAQEGEDSGIPDIVITARKVQETLNDAPVSVSVIGSDQIVKQGLNGIDDYAKQASGISFSQAFGRSTDRPVIRGQSNVLAGVQFGVETGAAYFVDGIYYQGDIQGFDPLSIDRVEIIKGPQSALYGRNTYSGAINFVTKDPTQDFTASGRARIAEFDEYEAAASISGPIAGDLLGFRAGGRYYSYGGQYTNQLTGKKVGSEETKSGYLALVFKPNSDIRWRVRGQYQEDNDGPLAIFLQGANSNNCRPGFRSLRYRQQNAAPPSPLVYQPSLYGNLNNDNQYFCGPIQAQPNNVRLNTDPLNVAVFGTRDGTAFDGIQNKQVLVTSGLEWDIAGSGWVISSLTGYRHNRNLFGTDSDHSEAFFFLFPPVPAATTEPAFANTNRDTQEDFNQEIRLATPQDARLRAQIGAFYYK